MFPIYGIKTKEDFKNSLLSRQRIKDRENVKEIYEYQLKEMYANGLTADGIDEILSCVEQKNFVSEDIIKDYSKWLLNYIMDAIPKNDDRFYSYDI